MRASAGQRRLAWPALAAVLAAACGPHAVPAAPDALSIRIVGRDHSWRFEYPGPDGVADTADDRSATGDLHIPSEMPVRLELKSDDKLYLFGVPALDARQIAMPDLTYWLTLDAQPAGRFDLLGDTYCGASYPDMRGQLVVEPWPAFVDWLEQQQPQHADAVDP
ncbi:MAG: hypothetical protein IT332_09030 [Ardenticatenales bacterium]|nr:hypothetical protein [Ardenticatenales bacterium]